MARILICERRDAGRQGRVITQLRSDREADQRLRRGDLESNADRHFVEGAAGKECSPVNAVCFTALEVDEVVVVGETADEKSFLVTKSSWRSTSVSQSFIACKQLRSRLNI